MVAAAQQQQQQLQVEQEKQSTTLTPAEEEALKRNTDCVYFLASPLTCKKGSECEYRHSEYARVNPRDCYYWLNGNCLNPKCGFRHPPLDILLGTQSGTPVGSSLPSSQAAGVTATHTPYSAGKQTVPCHFFQKGMCMKGDRCAFVHIPNLTSSKPQQPTAATPANETTSSKKPFGFLEKCTQERKILPMSASNSSRVLTEAKAAPKSETAPERFNLGVERNQSLPDFLGEEVPHYKATNVPSAFEASSVGRLNRPVPAHAPDDQSFSNSKEADEFLRESSPGFDVLVDDKLRQSDYYISEDREYGRSRSREGRNSVNEYETHRAADYKSIADGDREMFHDQRGYDSYEDMQGHYAWDHNRASSDRMLQGGAHLDRRDYPKDESSGPFEESDLRHRLSKQRRVNSLRSVVSHDSHVEERNFRGSRRTSHHMPAQDSSIGNRLQGRIKPARRSPVNGGDIRSAREAERERIHTRSSPVRPRVSHQGRLRDRLKGRIEEGYRGEDRNSMAPRTRRDLAEDRGTGFNGPKSLSELKVEKNTDSKEQNQSIRKRKNFDGQQQSEGDGSFKGPLPLSEILKRKRESASGSGISSRNKENIIKKETKESSVINSTNTPPDLALTKDSNTHIISKKDEAKSETNDDVGVIKENNVVSHVQSSQLTVVGETETEDGMIVDGGMDDHELQVDEQRDDEYEGEYNYEQVDDGEYGYEEGENAEGEEEYIEDDDDGDDFAKKMGVMFS